MPPNEGYGPANYGRQNLSPYGGFDNRLRYQDMVQHQMVSQYHQGIVTPQPLTLSQQHQVANDPRFSYGVQGGQNARMYQRNSEMARMSYGAAVATGAMDLAAFGASDMALGALGIKSGITSLAGLGGMGLAMGAAMIPMHFVNKGVQHAMDRRRFMAGMASDFDQYRDRMGFNGGLSYSQSTQLAASMTRSMEAPGQFFSRSQQGEIQKIALANNMISAKGPGMDSGSIKRYQRNMEELISTTEDIVKLLQTTKEGGLSVIKELQQTGFTNMSQIKNQVIQAKAFGRMTGIGSQNMMQIGAAGAAAVQGTPWSARAGAGMYQLGAASAGQMIDMGGTAAYAVQRAGGVAQAGAAIGNFAMNMMSSGIGTKLAAYAMKGDGSVDQDRLNRVLSGKAGAYEIVVGANQAGYAMGENKVRFDMFKEDMLNQMSDKERMQMVNAGFNAWSRQRPYSSFKNKAYVFAGMYSSNARDQRLMYERLMAGTDYGRLASQASVERAMSQQAVGSEIGLSAAWGSLSRGFNREVNRMGEGIVNFGTNAITNVSSSFNEAMGNASRNIESAIMSTGLAPFGIFDRSNVGDMRAGLENLYGLRGGSTVQRAAVRQVSDADLDAMSRKPTKFGINAAETVSRWKKAGNFQYMEQQILTAVGNNKVDQLFENPRFREGFDATTYKMMQRDKEGAIFSLSRQMVKNQQSINSQMEDAMGLVQTNIKNDGRSAAQVERDRIYLERYKTALSEGGPITKNPEMAGGSWRKDQDRASIGGLQMVQGGPGAAFTFSRNIDKGGFVIGTKGVSADVLAAGDVYAKNVKEGGANLSGWQQAAAALEDKSSRVMGVLMNNQKAVKAYKGRFDLDTAAGREDLGSSLLEASMLGTDAASAEMLGEARSVFGKNIFNKILSTAKKTAAGKQRRIGRARATSFLHELGGAEGVTSEFKTLLTRGYSGAMTKDEAKTMLQDDTYRGLLEKGFGGLAGGAEDLLKRFAPPAKGSESATIGELKESIKQLRKVASGELLERVSVKHIDGSTEDVGTAEGGEATRRKANRIIEDLKQEISDKEDANRADATAKARTITSTVRPPVLNYWNNRWVL